MLKKKAKRDIEKTYTTKQMVANPLVASTIL